MSSVKTTRAKLVQVKLDLAKKYDHRSKTLKSKTAQGKAKRRAAGYRHEAEVLSRM